MSINFKSLEERAAERMCSELKMGVSIFHQSYGDCSGAMPFNLESGYRYGGASALSLLMQKRQDPRWATSNQANRNHTAVLRGATGTLISFQSCYEIEKMFDENGRPMLRENGSQRTQRVKLPQPKLVEAWLFNGEQMRNLVKWQRKGAGDEGVLRAAKLLQNSRVTLAEDPSAFRYDANNDCILLPAAEEFRSPGDYFAAAVHLLCHRTMVTEQWAGDAAATAVDLAAASGELRTNLASIFLALELGIPYHLGEHRELIGSWTRLLTDYPSAMFNAASDAYRIFEEIIGFEKQEAGAEPGLAENGAGPELCIEATTAGGYDIPEETRIVEETGEPGGAVSKPEKQPRRKSI